MVTTLTVLTRTSAFAASKTGFRCGAGAGSAMEPVTSACAISAAGSLPGSSTAATGAGEGAISGASTVAAGAREYAMSGSSTVATWGGSTLGPAAASGSMPSGAARAIFGAGMACSYTHLTLPT